MQVNYSVEIGKHLPLGQCPQGGQHTLIPPVNTTTLVLQGELNYTDPLTGMINLPIGTKCSKCGEATNND